MKKALFKILGTLLTIVVLIIVEYYIRRYYDIDPRIWFFVVFATSIAGLIIIVAIFESNKEYFKTLITEKIKPTMEKMSNVIDIMYYVSVLCAGTGVMYDMFFHDDFIARTAIYITFLVIIALIILSLSIRTTLIKKENRTKDFVMIGIWCVVFYTKCLEFALS